MSSKSRQDPALPTPEQVATRLHAAAIHLLRRLRSEDVAMGLSPPKASALSVLVFGGPSTLAALAEAEQVRPPTMSRVVASLARAGLVERTRDPDDRRAYRLRATARGRTLLESGRARRLRVLTDDLARLPKDQFARLARAAETLELVARPALRP